MNVDVNASQARAVNSQASPARCDLLWGGHREYMGRGLRLLGSPPPQPPASHPFTPGEPPPQQQPCSPCFTPIGNRTWRPADPRSDPPPAPQQDFGHVTSPPRCHTGTEQYPGHGQWWEAVQEDTCRHLQHRAWHQETFRAGEHRALICPFASMCGHSSVLGALASQSSERLPELPAVSDKFRLS